MAYIWTATKFLRKVKEASGFSFELATSIEQPMLQNMFNFLRNPEFKVGVQNLIMIAPCYKINDGTANK